MSVQELIRLLSDLPPDAQVLRMGGEYNGDERRVVHVAYRKDGGLGVQPNTVLIS